MPTIPSASSATDFSNQQFATLLVLHPNTKSDEPCRVVVQSFLAVGAVVTAWDINKLNMTLEHERLDWDVVDIASEDQVEQAHERATKSRGAIATCVALAGLDLSFVQRHDSICDMPLAQWKNTHRVNVEGTFLCARAWLRGIRSTTTRAGMRNVGLVMLLSFFLGGR